MTASDVGHLGNRAIRVKQVHHGSCGRIIPMVHWDGFEITPGHPMFINGSWYTPAHYQKYSSVFFFAVSKLWVMGIM
jgi:hypothetical protein